MRCLLLCLLLEVALGAQVPLRILGVERRGLPPFEQADRLYVLDGGLDRKLRVGDRLLVRRSGPLLALGHLRLTEVQSDRSWARFEPSDEKYPMKGDLVFQQELPRVPDMPGLGTDPLPATSLPRAGSSAPPKEGCLYFLPQSAEISAAGLRKLETWIDTWGRSGRWAVQVPTAKGVKPALQKQRIEALQAALRSQGVERTAVETGARTAEGNYDPAWIRHWE